MNVHKKLQKEKRRSLLKIFLPLILMIFGGYFLYVLILEGFFVGWEVYFALSCYFLIFAVLVIIDIQTLRWMYYRIYIEDGKVKIRDGIFSRPISLPTDRLFYISSSKISGGLNCDTIFITDKRLKHKKVKPLTEEVLKDCEEHRKALMELKNIYPEKNFYYYRVTHGGYKFMYYFYMLYRTCERCKFSDTSMEIVKRYAEGK